MTAAAPPPPHKPSCSRREEFAPFQTAEAIDVRRKSDAFGEKLDAWRAFFQHRAPFAVPAGADLGLEHVSGGVGWVRQGQRA